MIEAVSTDPIHVDLIKDLIHGVGQPNICSGSFSPVEPVLVQVPNCLPVPFFKEMLKEHVDTIAAVLPQPYPTMWSPNAPQEAVTFRTGQFPLFSVLNFDPQSSGQKILEAIQQTLLPNDRSNLVAELHSMNIHRSWYYGHKRSS
jgi:hypothetical protein